jgi:galactose-1-phosphate uridylyltransferase
LLRHKEYGSPLLASVPERGLCRVVCFSPRHNLTLPELDQAAIEYIISTSIAETIALSAKDCIRYESVISQSNKNSPFIHKIIESLVFIDLST